MNALSHETSPYLLQHADNPVAWRPWSPEALALAERQDRPILLSIGYSACHWCHVMAHESFEDEATAAVMNEHFINIKVDREERPDLDRIYQTAHQLLTQRGGGWPLTLFLTPGDQTPFFSGTYFPREARYGLPAFRDLLAQVAGYYRRHQDEIRRQNGRVQEALQNLTPPRDDTAHLDAVPLDISFQQLSQSFDETHGGFGAAPKFPQPARLEHLLRYWHASSLRGRPNARALHMARHTLSCMAAGGIHDHLGGGFSRYAVDAQWRIPHFEKMLYDNALLLPLYAWLHALSDDTAPGGMLETAMEETAQWVMRDMQSPEGGYYAALDADSEGEEGRFYVWDDKEIRDLLTPEEYQVFAPAYGLDQQPNFEGRWHLHRASDGAELASRTGRPPAESSSLLATARKKLLDRRAQRVWPGRDDKILTAWNALMIRGMAIAARHLDKRGYLASATRALDFIRKRLWRDGRLLATYKDGTARHPACLDDYAFLLDALLEMLQVQWRNEDLSLAVSLADCLLEHFQDRENGGFFFTADDHEHLLYRPKPFGDDATPSGNGIAARALGRLGHLLGEPRYLRAAENTLRGAWPSIMQLPSGHGALLTALEEYLEPPQMIILRGKGEALTQWARSCLLPWAPRRLVFAIPSPTTGLPGILADYEETRDEVTAYLCSGTSCTGPISNPGLLKQRLLPE